MREMTERRFNREMERIKVENQKREWNRLLREERRKGRPSLKLPSTSKLILAAFMILNVIIIIFAMYIVCVARDTTFMYVLIGVPATMCVPIWNYYAKAKAENIKGGITYDMAMLNATNNNEIVMADDTNTIGDCEG